MIDHLQASMVVQRAFPGIRGSEAEELVHSGKIQIYQPGIILCHENVMETTFYILLDGKVRVTKSLNEAEAKLMKVLQPGDFFGEMALIHNGPRAATVTTASPVSVLEINKEAFNNLIQRNTSVSLAIVREVSRRLRENDAMAIEDLRVKTSELTGAYQQLAEQEHARSEFLTTIAHELRTPLTTANGFLQLARMGMMEGDDFNRALETVSHNIQEIITLVNDILFLQEMELILPEFRPTDMRTVVAAAVEQHQIRADHSHIKLNLGTTLSLPLTKADGMAMQRAIAAILDNAIKFSPGGGEVFIDVCQAGPEVLVIVRDSGVGIPPEALPCIFDRFFHIEEVGGYLFRGVGLGLSIARQVVQLHGGRIEVESELGRGSTFTVHLPI